MSRLVMTADSECSTCNGTGQRKEHRLPAGEVLRCGGGGSQVWVATVMCHCVRAEPEPTTTTEEG